MMLEGIACRLCVKKTQGSALRRAVEEIVKSRDCSWCAS